MQPEQLTLYQAVIGGWQASVYEGEQLTPETRFARALEEVEELRTAVEEGHDPREIAMEATDVIITMLGVIDTTGYNAENLLHEKIATIFSKYNPTQLENLRANGHSHHEAIALAKVMWDGKC